MSRICRIRQLSSIMWCIWKFPQFSHISNRIVTITIGVSHVTNYHQTQQLSIPSGNGSLISDQVWGPTLVVVSHPGQVVFENKWLLWCAGAAGSKPQKSRLFPPQFAIKSHMFALILELLQNWDSHRSQLSVVTALPAKRNVCAVILFLI